MKWLVIIVPLAKGLRYFASCAKGLEKILAEEINNPKIGGQIIEVSSRGVIFEGDQKEGYAAIMESRVATRISEEIGFFSNVHNREDVYAAGRSINWKKMLQCDMTVSVDTQLGREVPSGLRHSHFSSLTLKNALVDSFRERLGARPDVDARDADVPLSLYLHRNQATIFRSLTSSSLHKRGYRRAMHAASLRENVAAGCLALAQVNYEKNNNVTKSILIDPMCGSGTIPIEATLIALHLAPGLLRYETEKNYPSCLTWLDADLNAWKQVVDAARARVKSEPDFTIIASDNNPAALALTRRDAKAAGIYRHMHIVPEPIDAADYNLDQFLPPSDAYQNVAVVSNPPWGQRLHGAHESWTSMATFLRRHPGASVSLLCGNTAYSRQLRLRKSASHSLSSGGTDFKLLHYQIFSPASNANIDLKHTSSVLQTKRRESNMHQYEDQERSKESGDVQLERLTVVALKAHLRRHGLKVSGRKQDLIDRLREYNLATSPSSV
mmetsp:Transcript_18238/g.27496  ORF Transcript_18238/g.27496 Transcript_18238/m.27496 type:complete len:496 (+) Transcript_18238:1-1488(+)